MSRMGERTCSGRESLCPTLSSRRFPLLPKHILNLAGNMELEMYHRMMWAGVFVPE